MTLVPYTGNNQTNVSKDAKYTVTAAGDVRLVFRGGPREKELLTAPGLDYEALVKMVNQIKVQVAGAPGGAFYVNEYGDVLVPDGVGGWYFAGNYDKRLEFAFNGGVLTSRAAPGLEPGDVWEGPHPGIRHTLCAGGADVKYESKNGARTTEVRLSDQVGAGAARATAARIAAVKGSSGGRFYINEAAELFAPVAAQNYDFLYIGHLEDSSWFVAPKGFPRPMRGDYAAALTSSAATHRSRERTLTRSSWAI